MAECDICRGVGVIKLPVYGTAPTIASMEAAAISGGGVAYREFPCPQCSKSVDHNHVITAQARTQISELYESDAHYRPAMEKTAVTRLAGHLHECGYISFAYGEPNDLGDRILQASLGIVTPSVVATIEDRIAERQQVVASAFAEEAILQINNWGSHFGHRSIQKDDAARLLRDALKIVLARRLPVPENSNG